MSYDIVPIFGAVISAKLATLHEIRTVYTYDDILLMYDIICVDNYNQNVINQNQEQENVKNSR